MTALVNDPVPTPDPTPSRYRPSWVTPAVVQRLTGLVFQPDPSSEPVRPMAPYDGTVTAEVPATSVIGVVRQWTVPARLSGAGATLPTGSGRR